MAKHKDYANGEVKTQLTNSYKETVPLEYKDEGQGQEYGHGQEHESGRRTCCRYDFLRKISNGVVSGLENTFYR